MPAPHATVVVADADQVVDGLPVGRVDDVLGHVKVLHGIYFTIAKLS